MTPPPKRQPLCPSLPPEIWIRILTYHPDPIHLWTTCRTTSRTFRAYVEQVFSEQYLRTTVIDFHLEKYNLGGKSRRPEIPCTYARCSTDTHKRFAYFRDVRDKKDVVMGMGGKNIDREFGRIIDRWEDRVRTSKAEMPNYTLKVGRMVNDTALPELLYDGEKREIRFDWRAMFQLFFREQARLRKLKERYHVSTAKRIESNRLRLSKGERLTPDDLPKPWAVMEPDMRKRIRRERLREHYADNEEMLWAIDSLKYYESSKAADGRTLKVLSEIPGAGVGERWFGSTYLLQALYLDEWSCMHRIDTKVEHLASDLS